MRSKAKVQFSLRQLSTLVLLVAVVVWYCKTPTRVVKTDAVCRWLASQDEAMMQLIWSYEVITPSAGRGVSPHTWPDIARQLFGSDNYDDEGYLFNHLAYQGDGSNYFIWMNPKTKGPPAVVYIDIYGEYRVVGESVYDWPAVLANGFDVKVYSHTDPGYAQQQQDAIARFRKLVMGEYGTIPKQNELESELASLREEFSGWVERNRQE